MRVYLSIALCFFLGLNDLLAQAKDHGGTSQSTNYLYLKHIMEKAPFSALVSTLDFPIIQNKDGRQCIRLLLEIDDTFNERALHAVGGYINSRINAVISVTLPLQHLHQLDHLSGIRYIESDFFVTADLDSAKILTNTHLVHQSTCTPSAHKGSGVVVGIIDFGFDYSHPSFRSEDGSRLRIKRVWNQILSSGNPPQGYAYGTELADSATIMMHKIDSSEVVDVPHGTWVAGCAAGSGYGLSTDLGGAAPDADIVIVSVGSSAGGAIGFIDAISYIFEYAEEVGKPAVVNMSFSSKIGPHDGTSFISSLLDELPETGKIIVSSAGNSADDHIHLSHSFSADTIRTISIPSVVPRSTIDIWGEFGKNFQVRLDILNANAAVTESFGFVDCSDGILEPSFNNGSLTIIKKLNDELSNKPNFNIRIDSINNGYYLRLAITANDGSVHLWNSTASFQNASPDFPVLPGHLKGDADFTIGEFGGTSLNIFSVGAFSSKSAYTNLQGILHSDGQTQLDIADFSSRGPTVDSRIKPDITAPGTFIFAPSNHTKIEYSSDTSTTAVSKQHYLNTDYYFNAVSGTSFSAPFVAGIIALMLEIDPNLSVTDIKSILASTSQSDLYTGSTPNNIWGNGKIDACAVMQEMLGLSSIEAPKLTSQLKCYPNPSSGQITISSEEVNGEIELRIFDINGKELRFQQIELPFVFDIPSEFPNLFFMQLITKRGIIVKPIIYQQERP